jgi:hypothetical protein
MAVLSERSDALESINAAIAWLEQARKELQALETPDASPTKTTTEKKIAWGSKVSPTFKERVIWVADNLGCDVNYLMACMAWESGESFSASIRNAAGSGATGLIQFMPSTAKALGTTTAKLAAMTPEDQLRYVYYYFKPYSGRLHNLGDVYMAILWPKGIGQPDHYVLFNRAKAPTTFRQNAGLDLNKDGLVTRAECLVKINEKLAKGLQEGFVG